MTIRSTTNTILALLVAMAGALHAVPAGGTLALDIPGWSAPGPADVTDDRSPDPTASTTPAPDPLLRVRAQLTRAQELAQSGHAPEALSAVQIGLAAIDSLPPSRPGVGPLREDLVRVREDVLRDGEELERSESVV